MGEFVGRIITLRALEERGTEGTKLPGQWDDEAKKKNGEMTEQILPTSHIGDSSLEYRPRALQLPTTRYVLPLLR